MQFAHPIDHQLLRLLIVVQPDGGVLLGDLMQGRRQFRLVPAALGRYGQPHHGGGKLDFRQGHLPQRGAGVQILQLGHRHDIPRPRLLDRRRFARLDFQQRSDFDPLATGRTGHLAVFFQRAGKHTDKV